MQGERKSFEHPTRLKNFMNCRLERRSAQIFRSESGVIAHVARSDWLMKIVLVNRGVSLVDENSVVQAREIFDKHVVKKSRESNASG